MALAFVQIVTVWILVLVNNSQLQNAYNLQMCVIMLTGFLESGIGLLSVAAQLGHNGEPGGDGVPTTESRVRN